MTELAIPEWAKWLWSVFVPYLIYMHRKVDRLNSDAVRREEYNGTIESIRQEIHEGNKAITERFDRMLSLIVDSRK